MSKKALNTVELPQNGGESKLNQNLKLELSTESVYLLKLIFNEFDTERSGMILCQDLINAMLFKGIRFFDVEIYRLVKSYMQRSQGRINFKEFLELLKHAEINYHHLRNLAMLKSDYEYMLSMYKDVDLRFGFIRINLEKFGLSLTKIRAISNAFEQLNFNKGGHLSLDDIERRLILAKDRERIHQVVNSLRELNIENNGILTLNEVFVCMSTKKGLASVYNLLVIARNLQNTNKLLTVLFFDEMGKESKSWMLDLVEIFHFLDTEGSLTISTKLLREYKEGILQISLFQEKIIYESLLKSQKAELYFEDLVKIMEDERFSMKDALAIAKKFNECVVLFGKKMKLSDKEISNDEMILWPEQKSVNISVTDIDDAIKSPFTINRDPSASPFRFEGNSPYAASQQFSAVFGDNDELEKVSNEISSCRFSFDGIEEDEIGSLKKFLNKKFLFENDVLKGEITKARDGLASKEEEILNIQKRTSETQDKLYGELTSKQILIDQIKEECELNKSQLSLEKDEIKRLEGQIKILDDQVGNMNRELVKNKQKLTEKTNECLQGKAKIVELEALIEEKNKEINNLIAGKNKNEQGYEENISKLKFKLEYLTQKFSEYLTQNTLLQSEIFEKDDQNMKLDLALKEEKEKCATLASKLETKIAELEAKLRSSEVDEEQGVDCDLSKEELVNKNRALNHEVNTLRSEIDKKLEQIETFKDLHMKLYQDEAEVKGLKKALKETESRENLAKSLIEALEVQIENLKHDNMGLDTKVKEINEQVTQLTLEKRELLNKVNDYKLEFTYLQQYLYDCTCQELGSPRDSISQNNITSKLSIGGEMDNGEIERRLIQKPRESVGPVKDYIDKVETLEQKTTLLEEEIDRKNTRIDVLLSNLAYNNVNEPQSTTLIEIYKSIIENKKAEVEELKKRVREKSNLIYTNIQVIAGLEIALAENVKQTTEISQFKEDLLTENNRLRELCREQTQEIQNLKKTGTEKEKEKAIRSRKKAFSMEVRANEEVWNEILKLKDSPMQKLCANCKSKNQVLLFENSKKKMVSIFHTINLSLSQVENIIYTKFMQMYSKMKSLETFAQIGLQNALDLVKSLKKNEESLKKQIKILKIKNDEQENLIIHKENTLSEIYKNHEYQLNKQRTHYDTILKKLTSEIELMKKGIISDL